MKRASSARQRSARLAVLMLLALTCIFGCRSAEPNRELLVFAAASTADAVADVGREFEAETGSKVTFSFGASRDLARQIRAGAPAAILISADAESVDTLLDAKLVNRQDRRPFASNRLVVVVPKGVALAIRAPSDLAKVAHLAIGDPELVPAGNYAQQWLEKEGVWTDVAPHVVPALDVRAALATVEAGTAEAGIVYRTDAARSQRVQIAYEVPAEKTPTISYVAARMVSAESETARRFLDFMTGTKAKAIFDRHGFVL
jgi:molybdate transport system substrate-binding protein